MFTQSMIPGSTPPTILAKGSKWTLYTVLALLFLQCRFPWRRKKSKYGDWLNKHQAKFFVAHGICVYAFLYCFEGVAYRSGDNIVGEMNDNNVAWIEILLNIASVPLAWLLWDGGLLYGNDPMIVLFAGLHHLGVFIALPYHIFDDPLAASRNTHLFGWLWFIHSLGFITNIILFIFKIEKLKEGQKVPVLDRMREVYSVITVYLLYSYFFAPSQPGLGWNYQTISACTMLVGRYFFSQNYKNIHFFRRVEVPGSIWVFSSLLCNRNLFMGLVTTALLYIGMLALVVFSGPRIRPSKWDPNHPEIEKILSKFEKKFRDEFKDGLSMGIAEDSRKNVEAVKSFCKDRDGWQQKYPVIMAVAENDLEKLNSAIKNEADVNIKMTDWFDSTAGSWAAYLGRVSCTIMLLRAGVDPWEGGTMTQQIWSIAKREKITPLLDLNKELEPVAMVVFPPEKILSPWERTKKMLMEF